MPPPAPREAVPTADDADVLSPPLADQSQHVKWFTLIATIGSLMGGKPPRDWSPRRTRRPRTNKYIGANSIQGLPAPARAESPAASAEGRDQ